MFTDTRLRSLKPKDKVYRETDAEGLCLEIKPTGKKFWRYRFRYLGKQLMMTLGTYPSIGLADARKKRDAAKLILENGENPIDQRREEKKEKVDSLGNVITFKMIAEEYYKEYILTKSENYAHQFISSMKRMFIRPSGIKILKPYHLLIFS